MIDIKVRSWLNHDGYEVDGRAYRLDQIDELKEIIGDREINWIRGKNTFTGEPVSDKFMQNMKENLK